jgi:hypothetical protein
MKKTSLGLSSLLGGYCNETTHFSPIFPIILHTIMSSFVIT